MEERLAGFPDLGNESIPEWLMKMPDPEFYRLAMNGFSYPEEIQKQVLSQIIEASCHTEFGRKSGFSEIQSYEDFKNQVPVSEWVDIEAYSNRMADGETDILFPGKPDFFVITSGTTGNRPKLVPESETGAKAKQAVSRFRRIQLFRNFPKFDRSGYVLPLSNIAFMPPTKAGIPISYASGAALSQSAGDSRMLRMAFPMEILLNEDTPSRDYLLLRFALQKENVIMVVGNNAGRFSHLVNLASTRADEIIDDIENGTVHPSLVISAKVLEKIGPQLVPDPDRAARLQQCMQQTGTLLPGDYWPNLQLMAFWLSASVGHYIKDVRPLIPAATVFFDAGYGSSEARINIPSRPEDPAGTLSIYTAFYEFLPAHGGFPLLAHQLSDGQSYEIIVTTWSGLYRYNLKDTIMVKGFTGGTPNIVFQYKTGEVLNIAEEKVPASLVNDSIREVAPATGIDVVQIQIYAHQEERRYICYLEPTGETVGFDAQRLSQLAHKQVSKNCFAYDVFCNQQNLIHPLQIVEMKTGWQNHLYQTRIRISGSATQVKLPVMITEQAADEWIR